MAMNIYHNNVKITFQIYNPLIKEIFDLCDHNLVDINIAYIYVET